MHIYIYDSFLSNKKYESIIAKIETRITDLGLNGKIIRLGPLQSLGDSVANEMKKGAKTIVAVGDNALFHGCLNSIMKYSAQGGLRDPIPLGFVPINQKGASIASRLGVPIGVDACNTLSARRVEKLDVGKINNYYFLTEAIIPTLGTSINVDDSYSIEINEGGEIAIINLANVFDLPDNYKTSAQDRRLEFCIKTKKSNRFLSIGNKESVPSLFSFGELMVDNKKGASFLVDTVATVGVPAKITIAAHKISLIVGKGIFF
jgi:hypothetical protein